ncbi:MAG: CoA pyrophosphatase [Anaerolineaceae bacterium]|nr:CoA pyrophosphatase [Anaerolineaceae bacterium]
MNFTEDFISQRLQQALAAANPSSDGYAEIDIADKSKLKCAAVLLPLVRQDDKWHILFTRRTDNVESHKGQVSFPGGTCDEGETTPEQTALREVEEEIGVQARDIKIIGRMTTLVTISFFRVTLIVGVMNWPAVFRIGKDEVARVFTIPLEWLADASNRWQFDIPGQNRSIVAYHPYDGELLWGATARMTVDFLSALGL